MTKREKTLTAAVAGAGVLWAFSNGLKSYQDALTRHDEQQLAAMQELSDAETALLQGERARAQLKQWQRRSLPTNVQVAESKYYDWLLTLLKDSGLVVQSLSDNKSMGSGRAEYTPLTFDVDAQGTLENVSKFLYRFYAAPHLHRILRATLAPTETRKNVSVNLTVDALIVAGCKRPTDLADDSAAPAMDRPLEEVRDQIVSRNIFVPYEPKAAVVAVDKDWDEAAAKEVKISGLMGGGDGWLLSVRFMQNNNEVKYLRQGDSFDVGSMTLKLLQVLDGQRILLQCKDGCREVRLGQTIDQAVKIVDESSTTAESDGESDDASS